MSGLPSLLPLAAAILMLLAREVWIAHRRSLANRALHEARRPLQAMALAMPVDPGSLTPALPVWQAIRALGEVDRQINGGAPDRLPPEPIACRLMLEACVRRWESRARLAGGEIKLSWIGPDALVNGDPGALSAAVENLIVNAIEHGGSKVEVRALVIRRRLRVEIVDGGRGSESRKGSPAEVLARLRGSERHGHGLAVVRTAVKEHGGQFRLDLRDSGSKASIVLPCETRALPCGVPAAFRGGER